MVTLLFLLQDDQVEIQIQMTNFLYILQSFANFMNLYKLNNAGLYWNNKS